MRIVAVCVDDDVGLNESPSQKEGKCRTGRSRLAIFRCLNESPSEKERGNPPPPPPRIFQNKPLNESPSEKEGKLARQLINDEGLETQ